jgi:hypothetical protein
MTMISGNRLVPGAARLAWVIEASNGRLDDPAANAVLAGAASFRVT